MALPVTEKRAMANAFDKPATLGATLSYPHSSQVRDTEFRELRPRQGNSPWRALYLRVADHLVVCAIAPEALSDSRGFQRAIIIARRRLAEYTGALQ